MRLAYKWEGIRVTIYPATPASWKTVSSSLVNYARYE